jgi:hypothetical protein
MNNAHPHQHADKLSEAEDLALATRPNSGSALPRAAARLLVLAPSRGSWPMLMASLLSNAFPSAAPLFHTFFMYLHMKLLTKQHLQAQGLQTE